MQYIDEFKLQRADKQFEKLKRKYKDKKIILYGVGKYFQEIKASFDLSSLNIIAVSDKKYEDLEELTYDDSVGYNAISPRKIFDLKPDIVFLTVVEDFYVEQYFCEELFIEQKQKFKYRRFFKLTLAQIIEREFNII